MGMLPKLVEIGKIGAPANNWEERQKLVNEYIEPALQLYFAELGADPFQEVEG